MTRDDVEELHYIALIGIIPSVLRFGVLSHNGAGRLEMRSISNPLVQQRREIKVVPNAGRLHDYANLYFHARNPMMCAIQALRDELTVLRIRRDLLDLPNVIITDGNASSNYTRFLPVPPGLNALDKGLIFARDWRAPDEITYWQRKRARCAEVLVPTCVEPRFIFGAYVCSEASARTLLNVTQSLSVTILPDLFTI